MTRIQAPPDASFVSHLGVPYVLDDNKQFEVPEEVAPFFLREQGYTLVTPLPPTQAQPPRRRATSEQED